MSKVIIRLRRLLGYKPVRISADLPPDRYCIKEARLLGAGPHRLSLAGWAFWYCDGDTEWVSEARVKTL